MRLRRDPLPHRALAVVVGGDGERLERLEVDGLGAVGVEELGRGDGRYRDAGSGELGERDHLVGRVHRDAHDVLRERQLARVAVRRDLAGHRMKSVEPVFLNERDEGREAAAAGDDGEALGAVRGGLVGADDEVFQQAVRLDGRDELGVGGLVGRGLAHVLGRGCDVVHENLRRWMNGRAGDRPSPAGARPPGPGSAPPRIAVAAGLGRLRRVGRRRLRRSHRGQCRRRARTPAGRCLAAGRLGRRLRRADGRPCAAPSRRPACSGRGRRLRARGRDPMSRKSRTRAGPGL